MAKKNTTKKAPATSEKSEAEVIAASPLMQEGNDFQEDSSSSVVKEIPEEESGIIVAESKELGRTEPTRNPVKPAHFGETAAQKEKREDAEDKKADEAAKKGGNAPKAADFAAAHKALDLAKELSDREVAASTEGDAARMKRYLESAPTTRFMIPLGIGERHGAVETVTMNGYNLNIKKGVLVEIPIPVAEILMDHLNVKSEVAEKFDLHRNEDTEKALS